ncbi:MAG: NADH-ubiquinone oxidoreductase-F iron-sulfur binding region domain-containing protein [Saprospiraceae bacterium]|nr:NADH-ubiquinone oxidoreductase-F iron-sulfur binding region domain-containing protein [Saprospiraceae bacterium]
MSKNLSELSGRQGLKNNLFDRMGQLTIESGTPPVEELEKLAEEFLIGKANTYGAATFYDFMKPANKGKKVYVCNGSVCLCAGTQDRLVEKLRDHFAEDEIGHMCCLGRCHENNAFFYQGKNYSGRDAEDLEAIVDGAGSNDDHYAVTTLGTPVLTLPYAGFDAHYAVLRDVLKRDSAEVLEEIKTSGIRGRGGAGFPMGLKLQFCRNEKSDTKFIICNADEGDPGAFSDRWLLEERPHHVLFGMMVAGYCIGAEWGVVYIRAEYPESVEAIQRAVSELEDNQLLGDNIAGSGFNFRFKVIKAAGSYICGEETALINSIEGQRPEVRVRPPFPAQRGLFNKPTTVNNVETLAALHYILQNGGEAYAKLGTDKSSGTKLLCLDSGFRKPGLVEAEMGTPLRQVIDEAGEGFKHSVKAMHIGGPLGGLVPVSKIDDLTVDFESFSSEGFLLGHASVVTIPGDFPLVKYLEHLFEFAAEESCGKCFPCRLGTKRAQEMFAKAQHEGYKIPRTLIDDLLHTLEEGSLCAHGGGIPLPVRNALHYFEDELRQYLA